MTLSFPFRAVLTGLVLSAVSVHAQSAAKPTANAGPYQPLAQASPFNGKIVEERIAQVNEQIITSSDYDRAQQQLEADARQQNWTEPELAERRKDLLRDQIDKELLLSKGKELGITGETELIKRLDDIRKQNHLDSMEDLEKAAQQQGVSYEDFKQNIRNEIISQQVIRDQVSRKIQLTKADVTRYYQQHKSEFEQQESVHLAEILVPVAADDPAGVAQAQAKANEVETKLKAGASFEDMVKQYSSGPTAQTGGDLGDYKRGALGAKSLEDAAFALKTGQVAAPIRTKQGFLILKATQHVGGAAQDYASIEPQVEEVAFMDRMQPELRKYLTTLREQAYIDIRPGYEDAGAATHTVKPLYSAYTPPGQKKKAKVQKARYRQSAHTFRSKSGPTKQASAGAPAGAPAAAPAKPAATETAANTAAAPAAEATTPDAAATAAVPATTAAAPAASTPAAKPAQVAANTTSTKKVKKQKVRFGQTPSDTLAVTPGSTTLATNAPVASNGETQIASNESSNSALPTAGATPTTAKPKTRFSYRAREPKQKKGPTQDQLENAAVGQATPEEQAVQKQETAPVDLAGDTAKKKKEPKPKSDHKTRYAQEPKAAGDAKDNGAGDGTGSSTPAANPTLKPAPAAPATDSAAPPTPPAQQ